MQLPTRALTIKNPWAALFVSGTKDIENRSWPIRYRGWIFIHAGKTREDAEWEACRSLMRHAGIPLTPENGTSHYGGIVGIARIVDCVTQHPSPWFTGPFGWVLGEARPVRFHPCRGAQGLWIPSYPYSIP